MHNNKGIAVIFSTAIITFNSRALMAAEDAGTSSLPPYWPLLALVIIAIVFRKQLNCNPPLNLDEKPVVPVATANLTEEVKSTDQKKETSNTIDLKDDLNRCQAGTSKGTRCKRESALEDASISIGDKTYLLAVCKQHNTKKLKPFSGLIK
jgi:hypothetical protein